MRQFLWICHADQITSTFLNSFIKLFEHEEMLPKISSELKSQTVPGPTGFAENDQSASYKIDVSSAWLRFTGLAFMLLAVRAFSAMSGKSSLVIP